MAGLGGNARRHSERGGFLALRRLSSTQAGQNKIGPSLAGVFDRPSGLVPGYNYSAAMKNAHLTWDGQTLDKFLQNPGGLVHGTKMFANVPDPDARQRVIAYLKSLQPQSGNSK